MIPRCQALLIKLKDNVKELEEIIRELEYQEILNKAINNLKSKQDGNKEIIDSKQSPS